MVPRNHDTKYNRSRNRLTMTAKAEKTITHILPIIALAVSIIVATSGGFIWGGKMSSRIENTEKQLDKMSQTDRIQWQLIKGNERRMDEIRINLKTMMKAQNLEYQTAE